MRLLIITDIHFGEDKNYKNILGKDYINRFGGYLSEKINLLKDSVEKNKIDLIVNLGDLIASQNNYMKDSKQYSKGFKLLESLGKPIISVAGNHDIDGEMDRKTFTDITGKESYYSLDIGGYTHIILDGNRKGRVNGKLIWGQKYRFNKKQIKWLERTLSSTNNKCIVYSHYPIDNQDISKNPYWPTGDKTRVFPKGYEKVRNILEASNKVLAYFSGHTHFNNLTYLNNIIYKTVGSFAENDGTGRATGEYSIVNLNSNSISILNKFIK